MAERLPLVDVRQMNFHHGKVNRLERIDSGRLIVDGIKTVRVLGEEIAVRSKVYTIGGFSAHADQKELLEWLGSFTNKPEVFIVHGEENVALEFEKIVNEKLNLKTRVPSKGEEFVL